MYLILDSNLLHGRIKVESQELDALCANATKIGWTIFIPEPVVIELKRGAFEKYRDALNAFNSAAKELHKIQIEHKVEFTNEKKFLEDFDKRLLAYINKNQIQICPFSTTHPDINVLFNLATNKQSPFDRQGNNFRDVVIWYSSLELALKNKEKKVYIVTRDSRFKDAAVDAKVENVFCISYEEAYKLVEGTLDSAIRERHQRIAKEAEGFIVTNEFYNKVAELVKKDIEFPLSENPSEKIISIDNFTITHSMGADLVSEQNGKTFCRLLFIGLVEYSSELPAYQRNIWADVLKSISETPTKVGQVRKPAIDVSSASGSASLGVFGGLNSSLSNQMFGMVAETRKRYFVVDAVAEVNLKSDSVTGLNLSSVRLSDENPFLYIDFGGSAHKE